MSRITSLRLTPFIPCPPPMPILDNFNAWIEVGGAPLPEYDTDISEDLSSASCYIPSEAGKRFAISLRATCLDYALTMETMLDGIKIRSARNTSGKRRENTLFREDKVLTSATTRRSLKFAQVQTSEDEEETLDQIDAACIGSIVLKLFEARILGHAELSVPKHHLLDSSSKKVHEKSKKGIGHRVGFGKEKISNHGHSGCFVKDIRCLATFTFIYQPLSLLQADGRAPLGAPNITRNIPASQTTTTDDEDDKLHIRASQQVLPPPQEPVIPNSDAASKRKRDAEAKIAKLQEEIRRLRETEGLDDKVKMEEGNARFLASSAKSKWPDVKPIFVDLTLDDD